ncbi:phosphoribosyl-ATP diphosphatase [Magnetococcales bacterium HHB-1]
MKITQQNILNHLSETLQQRRDSPPEDIPKASYTAKLLKSGENAILRKIGEEATEVILAAKSDHPDELIKEIADLWFFSLVTLTHKNLSFNDVLDELIQRAQSKKENITPEKRSHTRHTHRRKVNLQMRRGDTLLATTTNISLNGLLVTCDTPPKNELLEEEGFFELEVEKPISTPSIRMEFSSPTPQNLANTQSSVREHRHFRFHFKVVRIKEKQMGLKILQGQGLFGFAISKELLEDIF